MDTSKLVALVQIVNALSPIVGASTALVRAIIAIRGTATTEEIAADLNWLKTDSAARKALSELALDSAVVAELDQ